MEISVSFGQGTKYIFSEAINLVLKKAEDNMYSNKLYEGPSVRGRVIKNIVDTINSKSPREKAHSERVSELCILMGQALKFNETDIKKLKTFALLHDIGKIAISDEILNKPGRLNEKELQEMKRHSEIGYRILSTSNDLSEIAEYALAHHERWDGKGYPKGIKETEIPLFSRICTIADAYDAMTSNRSYRKAMPKEFAIDELKNGAGSQFDPNLVNIFIEKVISRVNNKEMLDNLFLEFKN